MPHIAVAVPGHVRAGPTWHEMRKRPALQPQPSAGPAASTWRGTVTLLSWPSVLWTVRAQCCSCAGRVTAVGAARPPEQCLVGQIMLASCVQIQQRLEYRLGLADPAFAARFWRRELDRIHGEHGI